jgi:hypothetical protein
MTSLHQPINQESIHQREGAVERLHSRWSSSSRGGPSHIDLAVDDAHRRGGAVERLQPSDLKWASGSKLIADRPPSQPRSRRGSAVRKLQQSDSRWNSGSRGATFDTTSPQAHAPYNKMLLEPSNVSALEHSVEMKKHHIFETTIRAHCILNLPGNPQSIVASDNTGPGLQCVARSA